MVKKDVLNNGNNNGSPAKRGKDPSGRDCSETMSDRIKEMEKELSESRAGITRILSGSPIPTFVVGPNHTVAYWNKAAEALTGISSKNIIGTRDQWKAFYKNKRPVMADLLIDDISPEDIAKHYKGKAKKSSVIEGAYEAEGFFSDLGEVGKWLFFTAAPVRNSKGEIIGAIETLQDVTDRKNAEEKVRAGERRYKTFLDFVPYPVAVFGTDKKLQYINKSFEDKFGWTLAELKNGIIPYIPDELKEETRKKYKELYQKKVLPRYETRRLTKKGEIIEVGMTAALYYEDGEDPAGELVIMRDVTMEKKNERIKQTVLRIGAALHEYPDLDSLLDYVGAEVKAHLNVQGAVVILLDEEKEELFFPGASYGNAEMEKRVKNIRFGINEIHAGEVIRTGNPLFVNDTSTDRKLYPERDKRFGYETRNFLLAPLKSKDRIIGVLGALNKFDGGFDETDMDLLQMIAGAVALSIENARFSDELIRAYKEVTSLNRAKDKAVNHLSHELKTPVSVLSGSFNILEKKFGAFPEIKTNSTFKRINRNLRRIYDIQSAVDDIMRGKSVETGDETKAILELMINEAEIIFLENDGDCPSGDSLKKGLETLKNRLEALFIEKKRESVDIQLPLYVEKRLDELRGNFSERDVEISLRLEPAAVIYLPQDVMDKIFDGLIKNAVENTPDMGKIMVSTGMEDGCSVLSIMDFGVGITADNRKRIFEGFFVTQDTLAYSSKRPYAFNAGGKGADLYRMKIFSRQYRFGIGMETSRCIYLPGDEDVCPGDIGKCSHIHDREGCIASGYTNFTLTFPAVES